ncbi:sulfatase-like hydrolase/transferase [uncultured Selenomonas sp.]|uniref:sulfatase-like hydrolase/transferase n=1 Tax=uncultured Selenomonas sp. TaxID=159275 RepID=UPI00258D7AAA|nr:sulfatase-like hydrolase/transferase [uncultured Selenomonas sp.]
MQNDLATFWRRSERAHDLFYDLRDRSERGAYDEEYLAQLAAYRAAGGSAVHADIFAALYLLAEGSAADAAVCGERAFRLRAVSHVVWGILARAYEGLGRYTDALVMQAYAENLFGTPMRLTLPPEALTDALLDRLTVAMGKANYAPFTLRRMSYDAENGLTDRPSCFAGEFLPIAPHITPPYYVGVYTEQELRGNKAWLLNLIRDDEAITSFGAGDFNFDIMRAERAPGRAVISPAEGTQAVIPILGMRPAQPVRVRAADVDAETYLSPSTPSFFRLDKKTTFSSEHAFVVGTPICIGHAPHRRRLVLNIFVDALPWAVLRDRFEELMPNAARFFKEGLVFDRHYSTAEYTYPSAASIETGMYAQHSQIFNEKIAVALAPDYITLSERMKALGYATAALMTDGNGIYNGTMRGYDRLIMTPYRMFAYEAAERTIRHLDGLRDADHFILLHMADAHPWSEANMQRSTPVQTVLSLSDRLSGTLSNTPSPYLGATPLNKESCLQGIRSTDRGLEMLFSYLTQHYDPEEYIVTLYSDHGVSVFLDNKTVVEPHMTHAAWMMRGAGVPCGVRTDEIVSGVDIYPTLGALCGFPVDEYVDGVLPKIFGGTGREIAFSNSLFPTKAYYLAARAPEYSMRVTVNSAVEVDGTADIAEAQVQFYPSAHEGDEAYAIDSEELRAFFYPRVREFMRGIDNNGEIFPFPET